MRQERLPLTDARGTQRPRRPLRNTVLLCVLCGLCVRSWRSLYAGNCIKRADTAATLFVDNGPDPGTPLRIVGFDPGVRPGDRHKGSGEHRESKRFILCDLMLAL